MSTTAKQRNSVGAQQEHPISMAPERRSMSIYNSPSSRNSSFAGSKGPSRVSLGRVVDDELDLHPPLKLINIIFLPFHEVFRKIVLFVVLVKCIMGPLQSVYPIQYCNHLKNLHWILYYSTYAYAAADPIYAIDFFLHVVHRQVTDEAMKREHMPKSAIRLVMDLLSMLPLYRLLAADVCPQILLWPNILSFNEFLISYRVIEYFSLSTTHSMSKLIIGYVILCILLFNCLTCFTLLVTLDGVCDECTGSVYYDWRAYVQYRFPDLHENLNMYVLAATLSVCFITSKLHDEIKANTYIEFLIYSILMILGYLLVMFILMPKLFGEYMLRMRRLAHFHPRVTRIIMETQRRNPSRIAHLAVENFYALSWKKSRGLTTIPEVINELPRYLRLDIIQDLSWSVFYHSPTFRNTSAPYKRWLCEHIRLEYKFPGERFFSGNHCYTNLYYIKSGIVQLISADDSTSPLLSVSGGTLFGDISFYTPPLHRKVMVRCFTFCEIFVISRYDILSSLHKFREDRHKIMKLAQERINHARTLNDCKDDVRGQDRSKDEGIAWIKTRWWQISTVIAKWKNAKREASKCELPGEETLYHCAKYIGQLVLCANNQLATNTMFSKVSFPWILVPNSTFGVIWNRIVIYTLYLVILLYPPNLARNKIPIWFELFQFVVDVIYIVDILVSLMTAIDKKENVTFVTVLLTRVKTLRFIVDILSTAWIENVLFISGSSEVRQHCKFNRLLKTYMLFLPGGFITDWNRHSNPLHNVLLTIMFIQFCAVYVSCFFFYILPKHVDGLNTIYLFNREAVCPKNKTTCDQDVNGFVNLLFAWILNLEINLTLPITYLDSILGHFLKMSAFILMAWMKMKFIAALYLKYKHKISYHMFVAHLKAHYMHYKIHPDLLKRLDRYLTCHWKYFNGMDVLQPTLLKDEPYDIYWRFHGAVAEQTIGSSELFKNADTALIKELASKARFTLLPKGTTLSLFGVQCKNVTWVVNGIVKVEYHDEEGELVKRYVNYRRMISLSSVLFGKAALRTLIAATDCEILFITTKEFISTIKRYPFEWSNIDTCLKEFRLKFDDVFLAYVKKHRAYQKKLRDQIFHARQSVAVVKAHVADPNLETAEDTIYFLDDPETTFIIYWSAFRAFVVIINSWSRSFRGGSGAQYKKYFRMVDSFCDGVGLIDIALKMFMPFYDERGLIINEWRKCMWRYITHSFIIDLCGSLPVMSFLRDVLDIKIEPNLFSITSAIIDCVLLYNFTGFYSYFTDHPTGYIVYLLLLKWQIILITIILAAGSAIVPRCLKFTYDSNENFIKMLRTDRCWVSGYVDLEKNITDSTLLHMIYAQSLDFVQCALYRCNIGAFMIRGFMPYTVAIYISLGIFFWCLLCYAKTMLVLNNRGTSLFQYGVDKLMKFLKEERVPSTVIERVMNHYDYWWLRTKGMTTDNLMTERMGIVFKQDLYFYFFKKTIGALDELLEGGETFQRQLSNLVETSYFLPNEYITREMDLMPQLHVVHRGSVVITKNGKKLAIITKGGIFGQLDGTQVRPIRITALAHEHTDILEIKIKDFQETLTYEIRANIAKNPDSANDFLSLRKTVHESPFNTIQYILRGRKTVKLPWMSDPRDIQSCVWYRRWLYFAWLFVTTVTIMLTLTVPMLPEKIYIEALWALLVLDVIYFTQFVAEFFTMDLVVDGNKCVYEYIRLKRLLKVGLYLDLISFIASIVAVIIDQRVLHMARLLRMHVFFDFYSYFCMDFQTKATSVIMKFVLMIVLFHSMTCGWIYFACRGLGERNLISHNVMPETMNRTINYEQWSLPKEREGGCMRTTSYVTVRNKLEGFMIVGKHWNVDYIIAFSYVAVLITHTDMLITVPLNISQTYYKIFITLISYIFEIWISSIAISAVYIKFRELYQYDYNIRNLIKYLRCNGISKALIESLFEYTKMLWRRHKGNWLPELARDAPLCLREDIFTALYIHHLEGMNIFNQLPEYFLRQLACRFRRMVIFPGKHIVESGDIYGTMFFIHEGEVERWYTDSNGDSRIVMVLTQNQTFGNIPGLYPNEPFAFTYFSRTVVDMVYLVYDDWKDLIDGYPDLKKEIYIAARALKKQISMGKGLR